VPLDRATKAVQEHRNPLDGAPRHHPSATLIELGGVRFGAPTPHRSIDSHDANSSRSIIRPGLSEFAP
jgi:hypothetical protein